jgi:hypothetical protein
VIERNARVFARDKCTQYLTWIVNEHVPSSELVPNVDVVSGPDTPGVS